MELNSFVCVHRKVTNAENGGQDGAKMNEKEQSKDFEKINYYQGHKKWCFAIVLNRACDNYRDNYIKSKTTLFSESLLKFEAVNRKDWFDEDIRNLIKNVEEIQLPNPQKNHEIIPKNFVNIRLNDVRNYFSHFCHGQDCLFFKNDEPLRIIVEKAYEKAKEKIIGQTKNELTIKFPNLFESDGLITPAGVIFLSSFFVERRILSRLLGYVEGFKDTRGEFNITREIFSTYCLKDSYSILTPSKEAVLFRDILGYLSRVPTEFYKYRKEFCEKENHPERKTDKFISFALKYLEEFVLKELNEYSVSFGKMEVVRDVKKETNEENEEYKPHSNQGKVKVLFETKKDGEELPYYINHNTVIARIQSKGSKIRHCKIGINELKYLVLLCLNGKAKEVIQSIDNYIQQLEIQFAKPSTEIKSHNLELIKQRLPEFILKNNRIEIPDKNKEKSARLNYIREKWNKKKDESADTELHRKGRDIIRYINWHCKAGQKLNIEQYNFILGLLIKKDLLKFNQILVNLKLTGMIEEQIINSLYGKKTINELHVKVCELVLQELENIQNNEPGRVLEYIGVERTPDERAPSYESKVKSFIEQPMVYKGFLRETILKENKKTFAKLVEETLMPDTDVPLGKGFYFVPDIDKDEKKNRFHKDNAILYETLALDRLCLMMARECYGRINIELQQKSKKLVWHNKDGKEYIALEVQNQFKKGSTFSISFSVKDYTKLYVMDDAEFLSGLIEHFFVKTNSISYHELYGEGINKYTNMQKNGIEAILKLEEKIINKKNIKPKTGLNYISFREIIEKNNYSFEEQKILNGIRKSLLHYNLKFKPFEYNKFLEIMKREGFGIKNKGKSGQKWNQRSRF
jgi:hypothetical protein